MSEAGATVGGRGSQGFSRPLIWSAAGHVLALSVCLVLAGGGSGARLLPVVEVLVVAGGEPGRHDGVLRPAGVPARLERRAPGPPLSPGEPDAAPPGGEDRQAAAASPPPRETGNAGLAPGPLERSASGPAAGPSPGPAAPGIATEAVIERAGPAPDDAPLASIRGGGKGLPSIAGADANPRAEERDGGGGRGRDAGLLRDRIQSRMVYPEEAVRRGLQGEVVLRIHIEPGGVPDEIRIARSSGARVLDDAARRGVARAAPLPSSPGWVEVPVLFRLR